MKRTAMMAALALATTGAMAQEAKVNIGISGWTGFAPLTLAAQAGIFKKNRGAATIQKKPPQTRPPALASGDVQGAATPPPTRLGWDAKRAGPPPSLHTSKSSGAPCM